MSMSQLISPQEDKGQTKNGSQVFTFSGRRTQPEKLISKVNIDKEENSRGTGQDVSQKQASSLEEMVADKRVYRTQKNVIAISNFSSNENLLDLGAGDQDGEETQKHAKSPEHGRQERKLG